MNSTCKSKAEVEHPALLTALGARPPKLTKGSDSIHATNVCKAVYRVTFNGNIAIATGGTVEPISVALTINGEALGNATATVTPAAIGDFFNVSVTTFIEIPCGCCVTVSVENVSDTTAIDLTNGNIIFDRVA